MKPRLFIIFLLIVLMPLALLAWMGRRMVRDEREIVRHQFENLLESQLRDIDTLIMKFLQERERHLQDITDRIYSDMEKSSIRALIRKESIISQAFVMDPKGRLVYPDQTGALNNNEKAFLDRSRQIWMNKELLHLPVAEQDISQVEEFEPQQAISYSRNDEQIAQVQNKPVQQVSIPQNMNILISQGRGWYLWYWGRGIHLLYWQKDAYGSVIGAELDRVRLISDIIGELPDTSPGKSSFAESLITLTDSKGSVIYQWGAYEPPENATPKVSYPLSHPLQSWKLNYHISHGEMEAVINRGLWFNLFSGLAAVGLALVGLAFYFYRESSREIRQATQRVNFVNQVSHELKTPLTNIRMYAELLENELDEEQGRGRNHLDVIVTESQRLSRLIANVLTFARKKKSQLTIRKTPGVIDDTMQMIIDGFQPTLKAKGITICFDGNAAGSVLFDPDILAQIVGNLINNVEKYATGSGELKIATGQEGGSTKITIADQGPGIPEGQQGKIFQPFYRLSNKLTDGIAGTGIGLTISRELAKKHGGDLRLIHADKGACFQLVLDTPTSENKPGG
ncbi:sensor histidine kinase [Planctomycetota bacterium]